MKTTGPYPLLLYYDRLFEHMNVSVTFEEHIIISSKTY